MPSATSRQRRCAIPLSDANLRIARLDLAANALGAAWFQMNELEKALDQPTLARTSAGTSLLLWRCSPVMAWIWITR